MISIIVCSRDAKALKVVSQNVAATIGVPYELIGIDNSAGKHGICEAYNIGARQSQYEVLCFMHEDIAFHTPDWGQVVIDVLADSSIGVLGVAGGTYQPKAPAGWGNAGRYVGINVMHTSNGHTHHNYINHSGDRLLRVAGLDGLWLCCRKLVWEEFRFDAITFPGFHFYDVDFCIRVSTKYFNYLIYDILIEHFSHGTFNEVWMQNAIQFYKKRKDYLPVNPAGLTKNEQNQMDLAVSQNFIALITKHKLGKRDILFCIIEWLKLNPLNRDNLYLLKQSLFKSK